MKRLGLVAVVLVLLGLLGAAGGWFWLEASLASPADAAKREELPFLVPKGASGRALGPPLVEAGLVKSPLVWRFLLWRRGALNAKAGKHLLAARMTPTEVALALEAPPMVEDEPFVVLEGWRLRDTDKALAEKGWAKAGQYLEAARQRGNFTAPFPLPNGSLEGYLYPETYRFPVGSFTVEALIQRQLDLFAERFWAPHQADVQASGRTLDQLVVMASLLEREEPTPSQRPTVAGVLWKRFDKGTALGVDATSRYELESWNDRKEFLKHLRDGSDPYNTRTKSGLPPTALGATTLQSLLAAVKPEKNPYWYYLHDANRQLHPSKNAAEHEALRAKFNVY